MSNTDLPNIRIETSENFHVWVFATTLYDGYGKQCIQCYWLGKCL